jgi:F-type H+-transporting ATPase subunit epsilon
MLQLEIITPNGSVLDIEATRVTAPGEVGEFQVLPQHLPMLTLLGGGRLSYENAKGSGSIFLRGGVVEVSASGHVLVLSDEVQLADDLDQERAREVQSKAHAGLSKSSYLSDTVLSGFQKDLAFAEAVLNA